MTMKSSADTVKQSGRVSKAGSQSNGGLLSRNVRIHERRTSIRLEAEMWQALYEVARAENCSVHDLCGAVHDLKEEGGSFTAALRVFLMEYYRSSARASQQIKDVQKKLRNRGMTKRRAMVRFAPEQSVESGSASKSYGPFQEIFGDGAV